MKTVIRSSDGTLTSPLGEIPFSIYVRREGVTVHTDGPQRKDAEVTLQFDDYEAAMRWLAFAEVVVITTATAAGATAPTPATPTKPAVVAAPAAAPAVKTDDDAFGPPVVQAAPAAAAPAGEAPKKRGRPAGSTNKPKPDAAAAAAPAVATPAAAPVAPPAPAAAPVQAAPPFPPGYVAPAANPSLPPPYTPPTKPVVPQSTKKTIKVGNVGWGVEVVETMTGYDAHCTQIKTLVASGSSEEDALENIRQVIADYMAAQMPATPPANVAGPVEVVKAPTPPAPPAAPEPEEEPVISQRVLAAAGPSEAVNLFVADLVEENVDITIEEIVAEVQASWSLIPALRVRNVLPTDKITDLVKVHYNKLMADAAAAT